MPEENLISVIVPIFNVEKYLVRCVNSILRQSYGNIEVVLVDDGSSDESGLICDSFAKKDNRVKVIHQTNSGVATARNTGLDSSTGDYICFVDSDDYVHPDFIKYLFIKLTENDCDICMCDFISTEKWEYSKEVDWNKKVSIYDRSKIFDLFYSDIHCHIIVLWNKLIKRECIGNIRFDDGFINEDEGTTFKFLYNASKIAFCEESLYYYYSRSDSVTGVPYTSKRLDVLKSYENRVTFYREHDEEKLFNRECMFYLSEILTNYYKVYKLLGKNRQLLKELRTKYERVYGMADKSDWRLGRRLLYLACRIWPLLYGILKFG